MRLALREVHGAWINGCNSAMQRVALTGSGRNLREENLANRNSQSVTIGRVADTQTKPTRCYLGLSKRQLALVLLFIAPILFSSNMLVARATHDLIPPVALAFWRWSVTLLLLMPFTAAALWRERAKVRREWLDLLVLGLLGMGICGAFVYIGADTTTATNIGLIYAASPILIVVIARLCYREPLGVTQALGVAVSLAGVVVIVCRGDLAILLKLNFVVGDLWVTVSMLAWAVYSILLRHRPTTLRPMVRFAAITAGGVLILLPFHIGEFLLGNPPAFDSTTIVSVLILAVVASFGAYQVYGIIQRVLGAGRTGLLMYLIPIYNGILAFILLGEELQFFHLLGAALVLPGIFLATRRTSD